VKLDPSAVTQVPQLAEKVRPPEVTLEVSGTLVPGATTVADADSVTANASTLMVAFSGGTLEPGMAALRVKVPAEAGPVKVPERPFRLRVPPLGEAEIFTGTAGPATLTVNIVEPLSGSVVAGAWLKLSETTETGTTSATAEFGIDAVTV
jgi:hypothetical protein